MTRGTGRSEDLVRAVHGARNAPKIRGLATEVEIGVADGMPSDCVLDGDRSHRRCRQKLPQQAHHPTRGRERWTRSAGLWPSRPTAGELAARVMRGLRGWLDGLQPRKVRSSRGRPTPGSQESSRSGEGRPRCQSAPVHQGERWAPVGSAGRRGRFLVRGQGAPRESQEPAALSAMEAALPRAHLAAADTSRGVVLGDRQCARHWPRLAPARSGARRRTRGILRRLPCAACQGERKTGATRKVGGGEEARSKRRAQKSTGPRSVPLL